MARGDRLDLSADSPDVRSRVPMLFARLWRRGADRTTYRALPDRVRAAIAQQQDASERLISLVQLGVVATFGTLYFVAPKTGPADAFAPVPWVLSAYLIFTVIRALGAFRGRLPGWFLGASVIIDMALLMVLIWSFHLQYDQPASFYLKVPTLMYVFIFISLRALRFEARYVALAGVVAIAGWALLVAYAAFDEAGDTMITRNYVQYMTSNAILIGAEFDKIITIATVTLILAVALRRAQALLVRAVTEGAAARELSRFFDASVAAKITGAEHEVRVGEGHVRQAAILFVDIRAFTSLAHEMEPDAVMTLLAEYQALVVPVVQLHGGTIDKFLGDGVMASFGAAVANDSYAADAMRALTATLAAIDAWNARRQGSDAPRLRVCGAVAAGTVVFGAVGDESRMEYTVIGDPVNLAAKLEKHTKVEQVRGITSEITFRLAVEQDFVPPPTVEHRRGRRVAGLDATVDIAVVVA